MVAYTREMLPAARANLAAVLALVEKGKIRCSESTSRPSAASQRAIAQVLEGGDFYPDHEIQAFAWPLLLQAGGLANGPKLALTARGRAARTKDPDEVLRALWERWVAKGIIDELARLEQIKGQRSAHVLSALGTRRRAASTAIELLAVDEFVEIDRLFDQVTAVAPFTSARTERATWKFYIEHPQYGSLGYADSDFPGVVDRRYVMALLFEYAATLGVVDVRYVRPEGAQADVERFNLYDPNAPISRYDGLLQVRATLLTRV